MASMLSHASEILTKYLMKLNYFIYGKIIHTPGLGRLKYSSLSGLFGCCDKSIISFDIVVTSAVNHCHISRKTSKFSFAILLCVCVDNARAAVITCGP